jgi:hypothetical protein
VRGARDGQGARRARSLEEGRDPHLIAPEGPACLMCWSATGSTRSWGLSWWRPSRS